ncbi:hypothetical protein ON010_g14793 [Phytophthora cinnamomi]|nr:hypothetical protein ON010_g14793 [Phytophthora cinnamomi]
MRAIYTILAAAVALLVGSNIASAAPISRPTTSTDLMDRSALSGQLAPASKAKKKLTSFVDEEEAADDEEPPEKDGEDESNEHFLGR